MIVVTGASGQLGRAIIGQLATLLPADQLGISVRNPEKVSDLETLGFRVRQGDFDEPASLEHAFEGATQVLLVSSNARASGGDPLAQHRRAIDAAGSVGVRRIVYTSHMAASAASAFPPMLDHAATEDMLDQSGIAWTALRNGFYAASGLSLMGDALRSGVIETPRDGKIAWTAHADLAAAAARLLVDEGRYEGPTPPLTGPEAVDFDEIAAIASDLAGKPIRHEIMSEKALRARMAARGAPEASAATLLGLFAASRNGEFATVDPTLEILLGRRPLKLRDLLLEQIALH